MNVIGVIFLRLDHLKDEITRFASPGRIWLTILSAFGLYFIANAGVYFTLKELEPVHQMLLPTLIWTAIRVLVLSLLPFLLACWASQRFLQGNWVLHYQGIATVMAARLLIVAVLSVFAEYPINLFEFAGDRSVLSLFAVLLSYLTAIWFYAMLYQALRISYQDVSIYRLTIALMIIFVCLVIVPLLFQEFILGDTFWYDLAQSLVG
ncbi:MAG: hypothetical protein CUN56_13510 [Phototrophicales bacterium]|nr:MAG: hypothetical protein CUN56_13510 [Phototrophicales bacterium]